MSNPSKQKGTSGETKVARYLERNGIPCERKALAGSNDKGDLRAFLKDGTEVAIEVKCGEQTHSPTRGKMKEWLNQATVEGKNSGCMGVLVIIRYRRKFADAEVWLPTQTGNGLMMYIDEFVKIHGTGQKPVGKGYTYPELREKERDAAEDS